MSLSPQSFFDRLPGGADVYLLRKVLNDWPDRETVAVLRAPYFVVECRPSAIA